MNALEEENEHLVLQIQQAHHQIQNLQVKLAKLESHQQDIQPLILQLCRQQDKISSLEYSIVETQKLNEQLKTQNSKLLALANNEKKLHADNEHLKNLNLQLSNLLEQKNSEINNLTQKIKTSVDNYNDLVDSLPDVALVENLTSAVKDTRRELQHSHILNRLNYSVIALCLGIIVSIGYQTYVAKEDIHSNHVSIEKIRKGIYNSRGWSVLPDSQNNEWTFSQEHPALYQQWLEQQNP